MIDLLNQLLQAQSESEVHDCLREYDLLADANWRPYGGIENNSGFFLNQQASARGALVEKVVNSIDAVLMAKAHEFGDLPDRPPASMFEAAERYFDVPFGRLAELTASERRAIARQSVQVVMSGNRPPGRPTVTVTDRGEGQSPGSFQDTFLSLAASNKFRLPFVQGKFNMGSTGALPFCGTTHKYQLIVSRRNPESPGDNNEWGYTIVRRRPPRGDEKSSQFQFLAPGGEVLTVAGELPLWVNGDGSESAVNYGSLVRLFEYDIEEKTNAVLDFSRMLDRRLYRTPIPIQVVERRGFTAHSLEHIISGLETRLTVDPADVVEAGFPAESQLVVDGMGPVTVTLVPFRESAAVSRWVRASESIIFTVNGQAHAFEPRVFLRRGGESGVPFNYLAGSLLVVVDCSEISGDVVEQLFMGSRDRMRDIDQKRNLLSDLAAHLRNHEGLRSLNNQRRVNVIRDAVKSAGRTQELFSEMINASSEIAAVLRGMGTIPAPIRPAEDGARFEGRRHPTYLRWLRGGDLLEKECPANSYCEVELETDAENAFLSRASDPGECFVEPVSWVKSRKLWDGKVTIRLQPPNGTRARTVEPLRVTFKSSAFDSLSASGMLIVTPPHTPQRNPNGGRRPRQRGAVAPPTILEVYESGWVDHDFSDRSVARVAVDSEETIVFVNMDNRGLGSYCHSYPNRADEFKETYKLAASAFAISLKRAVDQDEVDEAASDQVLAAIGDVLVPAIDYAGRVIQ